MLSSVINVGTLQDGKKNVGFLAIPNWTLLFVVVLPFTATMFLQLIRHVEDTVCYLNDEDMFIQREPELCRLESAEHLLDEWRRHLQRGVIILIYMLPLVTCYSYWEAYKAPAEPIYLYSNITEFKQVIQKESIDFEIDWSVGRLLNPEHVGKEANITFTYAAFTLQIAAIMAVLAFFVVTILISTFYTRFVARNPHVRLLPSMKSPDLRRGFELIEKSGILLLITGLSTCLIFYLVILQDEYMRSSFKQNHRDDF
jgi:hypothetical protein